MVTVHVEESYINLEKTAYNSSWYAAFLRIIQKCIPKTVQLIDLSVILTSDQEIKKLNRVYRGKNRVTDVLSFFYPPLLRGERAEGELVVSIQQTLRQSKRYKTTFRQELARLVIHGILHMYGYDHIYPSQRSAMRILEKNVMQNARNKKFI